jgi:hypothetical protein
MRLLIVLACVALVSPRALVAQDRSDFRWEKALESGQRVHVHNINGDVTVTASSSGRVEIVGIRRGSGRGANRLTAEVHETSDGVVVCVVHEDSDDDCDDRGYHSHDRDDWDRGSMDLEIKLPRNLEIDASSVSGNVSVAGAQGNVRANSVSGDVRLERLRVSSLRVQSVSGEVTASIESLIGDGSLSFKTVSGDVTLELPRNLDADLSMTTVSGNIDSDFEMTLGGRRSRRGIEARIGRGGRDLDVSTVSGDLRLRMAR